MYKHCDQKQRKQKYSILLYLTIGLFLLEVSVTMVTKSQMSETNNHNNAYHYYI